MKSVNWITRESTQPRRYAANAPSTTAMPVDTVAEMMLTMMTSRPPSRIIVRTSRPSASVPRKCSADGGA